MMNSELKQMQEFYEKVANPLLNQKNLEKALKKGEELKKTHEKLKDMYNKLLNDPELEKHLQGGIPKDQPLSAKIKPNTNIILVEGGEKGDLQKIVLQIEKRIAEIKSRLDILDLAKEVTQEIKTRELPSNTQDENLYAGFSEINLNRNLKKYKSVLSPFTESDTGLFSDINKHVSAMTENLEKKIDTKLENPVSLKELETLSWIIDRHPQLNIQKIDLLNSAVAIMREMAARVLPSTPADEDPYAKLSQLSLESNLKKYQKVLAQFPKLDPVLIENIKKHLPVITKNLTEKLNASLENAASLEEIATVSRIIDQNPELDLTSIRDKTADKFFENILANMTDKTDSVETLKKLSDDFLKFKEIRPAETVLTESYQTKKAVLLDTIFKGLSDTLLDPKMSIKQKLDEWLILESGFKKITTGLKPSEKQMLEDARQKVLIQIGTQIDQIDIHHPVDLLKSDDLNALKSGLKLLDDKVLEQKLELAISSVPKITFEDFQKAAQEIVEDKQIKAITKGEMLDKLIGNYKTLYGEISPEIAADYQLKNDLLTKEISTELVNHSRGLFQALEVSELAQENVEDAFTKSKRAPAMPTYSELAKSMDAIMNNVKYSILKTRDMNAAVLSAERWIEVTSQAFDQSDFHSAYAISTALQTEAQKIMEVVLADKTSPVAQKFERLKKILTPVSNFKELREAIDARMKAGDTTVVPMVGIYSKDFTSTAEINKSDSADTNERKQAKIQTLKEEKAKLSAIFEGFKAGIMKLGAVESKSVTDLFSQDADENMLHIEADFAKKLYAKTASIPAAEPVKENKTKSSKSEVLLKVLKLKENKTKLRGRGMKLNKLFAKINKDFAEQKIDKIQSRTDKIFRLGTERVEKKLLKLDQDKKLHKAEIKNLVKLLDNMTNLIAVMRKIDPEYAYSQNANKYRSLTDLIERININTNELAQSVQKFTETLSKNEMSATAARAALAADTKTKALIDEIDAQETGNENYDAEVDKLLEDIDKIDEGEEKIITENKNIDQDFDAKIDNLLADLENLDAESILPSAVDSPSDSIEAEASASEAVPEAAEKDALPQQPPKVNLFEASLNELQNSINKFAFVKEFSRPELKEAVDKFLAETQKISDPDIKSLFEKFHEQFNLAVDLAKKINAVDAGEPVSNAREIHDILNTDDNAKILTNFKTQHDLIINLKINTGSEEESLRTFLDKSGVLNRVNDMGILGIQWIPKYTSHLPVIEKYTDQTDIENITKIKKLTENFTQLTEKMNQAVPPNTIFTSFEMLTGGSGSSKVVKSKAINQALEEITPLLKDFMANKEITISQRIALRTKIQDLMSMMEQKLGNKTAKNKSDLTGDEREDMKKLTRNIFLLKNIIQQKEINKELKKEMKIENSPPEPVETKSVTMPAAPSISLSNNFKTIEEAVNLHRGLLKEFMGVSPRGDAAKGAELLELNKNIKNFLDQQGLLEKEENSHTKNNLLKKLENMASYKPGKEIEKVKSEMQEINQMYLQYQQGKYSADNIYYDNHIIPRLGYKTLPALFDAAEKNFLEITQPDLNQTSRKTPDQTSDQASEQRDEELMAEVEMTSTDDLLNSMPIPETPFHGIKNQLLQTAMIRKIVQFEETTGQEAKLPQNVKNIITKINDLFVEKNLSPSQFESRHIEFLKLTAQMNAPALTNLKNDFMAALIIETAQPEAFSDRAAEVEQAQKSQDYTKISELHQAIKAQRAELALYESYAKYAPQDAQAKNAFSHIIETAKQHTGQLDKQLEILDAKMQQIKSTHEIKTAELSLRISAEKSPRESIVLSAAHPEYSQEKSQTAEKTIWILKDNDHLAKIPNITPVDEIMQACVVEEKNRFIYHPPQETTGFNAEKEDKIIAQMVEKAIIKLGAKNFADLKIEGAPSLVKKAEHFANEKFAKMQSAPEEKNPASEKKLDNNTPNKIDLTLLNTKK